MINLLLAVIYVAFISLGLPDALLGAAWPVIYPQFGVPVASAGVVSMIIACGTIFSSLMTGKIAPKLGTGRLTAVSVATTAAALLGFSLSAKFWHLCLWAVPYGLGAGSVDACLNNYVATNYASRHMSWLHCMWGIGAATGPYIMGFVLTGGLSWNMGYCFIGIFQVVLTCVLLLSLKLWKNPVTEDTGAKQSAQLLKVIRQKGVIWAMVSFFCYCAAEQTAMLWSGSYLVLHCGMEEKTAAFFAGMFLVGITAGRFVCGFLTFKFSDKTLVRTGVAVVVLGAAVMLLSRTGGGALAGAAMAGIGCAPVYPCLIHATPANFGMENSQAVIGLQMASANLGVCIGPPLFGLVAQHISISLMPVYMLVITLVLGFAHETILRGAKGNKNAA